MTANYAICQREMWVEIPTCQNQMKAISFQPSEIFNTSDTDDLPDWNQKPFYLYLPGRHLLKRQWWLRSGSLQVFTVICLFSLSLNALLHYSDSKSRKSLEVIDGRTVGASQGRYRTSADMFTFSSLSFFLSIFGKGYSLLLLLLLSRAQLTV